MKFVSQHIPVRVLLMTIFVAFLYDIKCINATLSSGGEEENGIMAVLYMIGVAGVFGLGVLTNINSILKMPKSALLILASCCMLYFLTTSFIGEPRISLVFFMILTVAAFIVPFVSTINVRMFMKVAMFLSIPALAKLDEVFAVTKIYADAISMGMSYAFLSPIIISIIYLFTYFRDESKIQKFFTVIGVVANFILAFFLISMGSRGPVLAIIVTLVFMLTVSYNHNTNTIDVKKRRLCIFAFSGVGIYLLFIPIMIFLQSTLLRFGLSFHFVDKILLLQQSMDLANGRDDVLGLAFSDISKNWLFGYGLDRFEANHPDYGYPHNSVVQMLYDGGLFFFAIIILPISKKLKHTLKFCSYDEFVLLVALFFASIPGSMFSGDLWRTMPLWIFFGAVLSKTFIYNNEKI